MTLDARSRYLTERVMTASPARRLVMLYDRLLLDLSRAELGVDVNEPLKVRSNLLHAVQIVAELKGSLQVEVWSAGTQLDAVYSYLLQTLAGAMTQPAGMPWPAVRAIITELRDAWDAAADQLAGDVRTA